MSAGYAACSCQEAEALKARVAELESLLEAAAGELDKRDEALRELRKRNGRWRVALGNVAYLVHYATDESADLKDIRTVVTEALRETP